MAQRLQQYTFMSTNYFVFPSYCQQTGPYNCMYLCSPQIMV